jgi:ABC-type multidrug transport system fused ATPase/permease subunit
MLLTRKVLSFINDIFRLFPGLVIANVVVLFLANLITVFSIFSIAPVVDFVLHPDLEGMSATTRDILDIVESVGLPTTLMTMLAIFCGLNVSKSGFLVLAGYVALKIKYSVQRELVIGTFVDFFNARWQFFSGNKQGTLLNTLNREMDVVSLAYRNLVSFFSSLVEVSFYLFVPFYISWQVTTLSLVLAVLLSLPILLLSKFSYRLGQENTSTANVLVGIIHESMAAAKVVLGFGNHHKSVSNFEHAIDAHIRVTVKSQSLGLATSLLYEPLALMVVVIALLLAQRFELPLSELAVLLWALRNSIPSIGGIATQKNTLTNFIPSYEQIKDFRKKAKQLEQPSGADLFSGFDKEISIEGVSFAYPGHQAVLSDINIRIPKGSMVAIVGESGSGKSTLIDLIMGFNEPAEGRICFDDKALGVFDIVSYRRRIGYVPQDSILFNMSIRDNLYWARDNAGDEEIEEACAQANATEFVNDLSDGYDTLVGDRGVRLSGGQRQRLALARAILRKPDLLILDEATSSLDTYSERLIQEAIEKIALETTVIVVAHRLSTIVNADYVYVLEKGRIVEEGDYRDLVDKGGQFARMTQLQLLQ